MATREDIYAAIKNADAAGDSESVKKLGAYLQSMDAPTPKTEASKQPGITDLPVFGGVSLNNATSLAVGGLRGIKDGIDTGAGWLAHGYDKLTGGPSVTDLVTGNRGEGARIDAMNAAGKADFAKTYADDNFAKMGRVGGQALITAPVGGILGQGARLVGAGPKIVNALTTGGFTTGAPTTGAANLVTRAAAGAATGGATMGLIDPEHAGTGAVIGGALPGALKLAGAAGTLTAEAAQSAAKKLMQSALKPTAAQLKSGEAATATQTLLDYGINPTASGVNKLKGIISDLNDQVSSAIQSSSAAIDPSRVVNALNRSNGKFANQVAPTSDLAAIDAVKQDFLSNSGAGPIPVQLAQKVKQGTYSTLRGKFGEQGSAAVEAQKDLARGLKEQIAEAVPAVAPLNAEESRLLATLSVAERRALADANKNPMGLAALAQNPVSWAMFMADRSAAFKSLAARALNNVSKIDAPPLNALAGPALYRSLPRTQALQNP